MNESGNIAWGITATALVLFMTPGLAFFYGGLVKAKSVISMMMMSFGALGLIGVLWILYGYNMSHVSNPWDFAGDPFTGFGLVDLVGRTDSNTDFIGVAFGATFAIITVALISGAIADRAKFGSWMLFAGLWATVVYFPVAAWVWGGGWIANLGNALGLPAVIDWSGGTAVEINSGAAALALALVLGKRMNFRKGVHQPHNVPLTLIGAAILWFGWFGFNAGANWMNKDLAGAGLVVVNTIGAAAAAALAWVLVERIKDGKPTSVGAASGAITGLVAITPSCMNLTPGWGLLLGAIAGAISALAVELKFRLGFDDSLDVVGIHLVGGLTGMLFLGFFATGTGLLVGGDGGQLAVQSIAAAAVLIYSFAVAYALGWLIEKTLGFRITNDDELAGIDSVVHGEEGYVLYTGRDFGGAAA
ncbi:MAG: ammonium transporter [Microbacteriaceae bacterium]